MNKNTAYSLKTASTVVLVIGVLSAIGLAVKLFDFYYRLNSLDFEKGVTIILIALLDLYIFYIFSMVLSTLSEIVSNNLYKNENIEKINRKLDLLLSKDRPINTDTDRSNTAMRYGTQNHKKITPSQEEWICPSCGTIMPKYITTCTCGTSQEYEDVIPNRKNPDKSNKGNSTYKSRQSEPDGQRNTENTNQDLTSPENTPPAPPKPKVVRHWTTENTSTEPIPLEFTKNSLPKENICLICKATNPEDALFCRKCGKRMK